jgi:hypothetical protein
VAATSSSSSSSSSSSYAPLNSMAAAAKIVFSDIQVVNACVPCEHTPSQDVCKHVHLHDGQHDTQVLSGSLTIPDDLYSGIFADAHAAGARMHSNSWGCGLEPGDAPNKCNVYAMPFPHCIVVTLCAATIPWRLMLTASCGTTRTSLCCLLLATTEHKALAR